MRFVLLLLSVALLSCQHEFPPPTAPADADDQDPDGALPADQRAIDHRVDRVRPDLSLPQCTAATAGTADCTKEEGWSCIGVCENKHRYACQSSQVREIRCPETGACECWVGSKVQACPSLLDNGRTGCDRCLEAFRNGCCRP